MEKCRFLWLCVYCTVQVDCTVWLVINAGLPNQRPLSSVRVTFPIFIVLIYCSDYLYMYMSGYIRDAVHIHCSKIMVHTHLEKSLKNCHILKESLKMWNLGFVLIFSRQFFFNSSPWKGIKCFSLKRVDFDAIGVTGDKVKYMYVVVSVVRPSLGWGVICILCPSIPKKKIHTWFLGKQVLGYQWGPWKVLV